MSDSVIEEIGGSVVQPANADETFVDLTLQCIDCAGSFVWTAGEQLFFREKALQNPPKRCKPCKKAKNLRLDSIERSRATGRRHRIEVRACCDRCEAMTTVPFYPCQGRPVYCRSCYTDLKSIKLQAAHGIP